MADAALVALAAEYIALEARVTAAVGRRDALRHASRSAADPAERARAAEALPAAEAEYDWLERQRLIMAGSLLEIPIHTLDGAQAVARVVACCQGVLDGTPWNDSPGIGDSLAERLAWSLVRRLHALES
jgi:hypothetical protein